MSVAKNPPYICVKEKFQRDDKEEEKTYSAATGAGLAAILKIGLALGASSVFASHDDDGDGDEL